MEIYHTLNRGVDKRTIFLEEKDYFRFIHNLFEFNDENSTTNSSYFFNQSVDSIDFASRYFEKRKRRHLVRIHAFCLMPNHYHLMLSPLVENGITRFMQKLNIGYAKYFNEKNKRTGALFEGRYKSVLVQNQSHFIYLPYYIHLNPLDLFAPGWREKRINNFKKAFEFLENYRWSSLLDYIGEKNFPSVISCGFLQKCFGGPKEHKSGLLGWLKEIDLGQLSEMTLE